MAPQNVDGLINNNRIIVVTMPLPNNIKSNFVNMPNINKDFLAFEGIK